MTEIAEFKEKLNEAIEKRMQALRQSKTEVIDSIAVPLNVKPRQIWKWLSSDTVFPQNARHLTLTLDTMINEAEKFKSDVRAPALPGNAKFPFKVVVPRETLKVSQDDRGNLVIHGSLSLDLL